MACKIPPISLLSGKKSICYFCKTDLIFKSKTFEMHQNKGDGTISVTERILFCPTCSRYFISQAISRDIVKKHPGYYIDLSTYKLKHKPKSISKTKPDNQQAQQMEEKHSGIQDKTYDISDFLLTFWKTEEKHPDTQDETLQVERNKPQSITSSKQQSQTQDQDKNLVTSKDVYFSNSPSALVNSCPICGRVLETKIVNIPTIDSDRNFYRYYAQSVRYCNNCQKAFITEHDADKIVEKIQNSSGSQNTTSMKLSNGTIRINGNSRNYLFSPSLDNSYLFYAPEQESNNNSSVSNSMKLNTQSFLGKLGYSVNKSENERRHILTHAVSSYGKRRVTDHLAFLITTRRNQKNGASKYSSAIKIWQDDLNYVFNMQIK